MTETRRLKIKEQALTNPIGWQREWCAPKPCDREALVIVRHVLWTLVAPLVARVQGQPRKLVIGGIVVGYCEGRETIITFIHYNGVYVSRCIIILYN